MWSSAGQLLRALQVSVHSYDGARKPSEELSSEGPHGSFIKFTLNSLCNIYFITLGQFLSISGVDSAASIKQMVS